VELQRNYSGITPKPNTMKIYQIAGQFYAVSGDDLFEKIPEFSPVEQTARPGLKNQSSKECECGRPAGHRGMHRGGKLKKSGVKRRKDAGRSQCGVCHESGHNAKTCPDRKTEVEKSQPGSEDGLVESVDLRTRVQELKAAGATSVAIAQKLGIRLVEVNKYW
jgi:hypothetical protein